MSNSTKDITQTLYPVEWLQDPDNPNYVLYATALITTGYTFSADVTVTDVQGNTLGTFTLSSATGFTSVYLGSLHVPTPSTANAVFPIRIQSAVTCSTDFESLAGNQVAGGSKPAGGKNVPICYEVSSYCNDAGSDNDWNDCVLQFQLYNASTD